jgi:hypothetical protein
MFVPLSSSRNVMIGGAIPPLRRNPEDNVVLASEVKGSGSNQIVGVHNAAPKIKTLAHDKNSQDLVFHGSELLNKIKFGAKKNKRENIKFLF